MNQQEIDQRDAQRYRMLCYVLCNIDSPESEMMDELMDNDVLETESQLNRMNSTLDSVIAKFGAR